MNAADAPTNLSTAPRSPSRRSWTRRVAWLFVLVLLAAALNVAVAWGCLRWSKPGEILEADFRLAPGDSYGPIPTEWPLVPGAHVTHWGEPDPQPHERFKRFEIAAWGQTIATMAADPTVTYMMTVYSSTSRGARWERGRSRRLLSDFTSVDSDRQEVCAGWPLLSVHAHQSLQRGSKENWPTTEPDWMGVIVQKKMASNPISSKRYPELLPYLPLWPGFLANTALYAVVLWLPVFGVATWKRRRRRRLNHCERCGYSRAGLGASVACPECGAGASSHVRAMR